MKEGILALLYSVEAENIELARQLISGLEESADKTELLLIYGQLEEAAAHFKCSIAAMLLGLGAEEPMWLMLNDLTELPNWLAALSGRIRRASWLSKAIDLKKSLENIAYLKGLKELTLEVKTAEDMTAFFGLTTVERLICYVDEGGKIGENIVNLKNLRLLNLHCDNEIELPSNFATLATLATFDCQYPIKAAALGAQVFGLPSLRVLSIDASALRELPTAVKDTRLEALLMNGYGLADLPPLPPTLKDFELTQVTIMKAVPSVVFDLPNLVELRLSGIMLANLDEDILTLAGSIKLIHIEASLLTQTKANYWHERLHRQFPEADIYIEGA